MDTGRRITPLLCEGVAGNRSEDRSIGPWPLLRERMGGVLLTGPDAVKFGLLNLLYTVLLNAGAWAIWYFWQQYED